MADAGVVCDACKRLLAGCCVETLQCGHCLCGECSSWIEPLDATCPVCEASETEDCDVLSCSEDFACEADCPVQLLEDSNMNMSVDDTVGSDLNQLDNVDDRKHAVDGKKAIDAGFKNPLGQVDEALVIANETFHHLNAAVQTLGKLKERNTMIESSVSNLIVEEFENLSIALYKRKLKLLAELKAVSKIYTSDLENAAVKIEEQKKCLKTRIEFAEGLKREPLLAVYCDLKQIVADLKVIFNNESMIDIVKAHPDIRFSLNRDLILKFFEKLGNICSDHTLEHQLTSDVSSLSINKESFCLDIKPVHSSMMHVTEYEAQVLEEQLQTNLGHRPKDENKQKTNQQSSGSNHVGLQKSNLLLGNKCNSQQRSCSPDVIIEEIIEDDHVYLMDLHNNAAIGCHKKNRPTQKESNSCKPKKFKKSMKGMVPTAPFHQRKISQELVYLCHMVDPCNFYVHRLAQKKQIIMLERMLNTLSQSSSKCCPTDVLEIGEIVAFRSLERNAWCRGCITELIPLESKFVRQAFGPAKYRIQDISSVKFFLLDYGSSEVFVVARFAGAHLTNWNPMAVRQTKVNDLCHILTKLTSEEDGLRYMPTFAINCSLDIVPQSLDGLWAKEIKDHILKVVNNKTVVMKVFREESKKLIVDLKKPSTNKISSDMPVSLRDALVFLEMAKFPSNISSAIVNVPAAQYSNPILPKNMTEVIVIICHMSDPSDFYIHVLGLSEYVKLVDKIQVVYNSKESDDLKLLCPAMGQACIAKYDSEDELWYRAEVIGLPSSEEAIIKYVDFGNVATINIKKLRQLKDEFLSLPRQAICCRLAYIQPIDAGLQWSLEACKLFEELTTFKHMRLTSIGVLLDNKLSVELFDAKAGTSTSINTLLVKGNVAAFIPCTPVSNDQHLPLKEVWDPVTFLPDTEENCMDSFSLFEQKQLDVFVSHVISPSRIYVQWLSTANILKSLQSAMSEKYVSSEPESVQWQIDMHVAVQLQIDYEWRRGKIKNIISEKLVEVFCYDFGIEEVTDVMNLRTLDESLKKLGTMCLECTLMDIQPAGGSQNWTATACDFLRYYLNGATATLTIEENTSQWPLPVKIVIKNEAGQLVDVSDHLIRKGLALRDRRLKKLDSLMEVNETKLPVKEEALVQKVTSKPEYDSDTVTNKEEIIPVSDEPMVEPIIDEPYRPPLLPEEKTFSAKVTYVAEDGTIYVIQESLENELGMLMLEIQNSFKCLGLLQPYCWKKGEGCLIKGSDTMSYRGKVLEILGGDMMKVQYEDFGYIEKIPTCHIFPTVFNPNIPRFCIQCQLNDVLPVGKCWQQDTIAFLKELLVDRIVSVQIVEPPDGPRGIASIYLYCGSASVSAILEKHSHCIPKDCEKKTKVDKDLDLNDDFDTCKETQFVTKISHEKIWRFDFKELLQTELETSVLPNYTLLSLPGAGQLFPVRVTHLQTPNIVFITMVNGGVKSVVDRSGEGDHDSNLYSLESSLERINYEADALQCVTDFRTAMPCLAYYTDGLIHRAKLQSIKSYDPVTCVVEFIDYGSTTTVDTSSLFQIPAYLLDYPAKAVRVKLAGFKPPKVDFELERIPYCEEWSFRALTEMIDLVQKKSLFAACVSGASENIVFLYDEKKQLVHQPLIVMGLAEVD
ncbi:RING finger protein 17 isoform X2 [Pseudophryne corroboree]|uniref:RING finger protein 17 isoform X2 n=1 Tax=Pseudophryne corroboree TaxID=495146 RepID=UPI003081FDC3